MKNLIPNNVFSRIIASRGLAFGVMVIGSLVAFEVFNYASTEWFFHAVLGEIKSIGIRWSILLTLGLWGLDFAGISRILTSTSDTKGFLPLLAAWVIASLVNVGTTWFITSMILANRPASASDAILAREIIIKYVPIFFSAIILLIRFMIISSVARAGAGMFTTKSRGV